MGLYLQTPTIESTILAEKSGLQQVWLKLENLQPSGSFKNRGLGRFVQSHVEQGARCFVCSSGGNAGLAVAQSARRCGASATIVVWKAIPDVVIKRLRSAGADVTVHGETFADADALARQMAQDADCIYTSPYDDPLIWEGHATIIDEAATACRPEVVVVSVGGGGLMSGVLEGMHRNGLENVPLIAVETEEAPTLRRAIEADQVVDLPAVDTVAKSLAAKRVAENALSWTRRHRVISELVTDREAVNACLAFADDHRMLVEPACGAALAPFYARRASLAEFRSALVIVCGGSGVTLQLLDQWNREVQ